MSDTEPVAGTTPEPDEAALVDQTGAEASASSEATATASDEGRDYLDDQADAAEDFLNGLLDVFDMDGEAEAEIDGENIDVVLEGPDLAVLIGRGGATLDALQDLTRAAVHTKTGERALLTLDIAGYRERQRARLEQEARDAAETVLREKRSVSMDPMSAFERLVVHQALASLDGITTSSSGEDPERFVVVSPA